MVINGPSNITTNAYGEVTFRPTQIPFSAANFANPMRGLYTWRHLDIAPTSEIPKDAYNRFVWKDLESTQGVYNFSKIDEEIALAKTKNQKFGFNVRSMLGYNNGGQIFVPPYLQPYGWLADSNGDGTRDTYIPDWNHPYYLERAEKLVQALGEKYNNNPDIAWVEIGLYGQWGEWTIKSEIDYSKAPSGIVRATDSTKRKLIDIHVASFPQTQLLSTAFSYSNMNALLYAFSKSTQYPVGWRVNCLGQGDYFDQFINHPTEWDKIKDRWKIAPAVGEFCYIKSGNSSTNFAYALDQVTTYHISTVGNGNTDPFNTFSSAEQQNFLEIDKRAGYRYVINNITLPGIIHPGTQITISSQWNNVGSAPAYEPWEVQYVFVRENSSIPAWTVTSTNTKLITILPNAPVNFSDSFLVPSQLPAGNYYLHVLVTDSRGFRSPMKLAINGLKTDGKYTIGMVVFSATPTPTRIMPTPTPTPTQTPKPGDLDHDGDVDIFDYNLLIQNFNQSNCSYNLTGSCLIDIFDYNLLVSNIGK